MKKSINDIHLIIGFVLIFLVPIAQRIDDDFLAISKILAIGYWGLVTLIFFFNIIKESLRDYGAKKCLFSVWLFVSILFGAVGLYSIVMHGQDGWWFMQLWLVT